MLKWKTGFADTAARFEAWWRGEVIDRPPVTVFVKSREQIPHQDLRNLQDFLDVDRVVESSVAQMESRDYLGDSFPVFFPPVGPGIIATLFGCEIEFNQKGTLTKPVVHRTEDWQKLIDAGPDFSNPFWRAVERMTDYAIEISGGGFLVGMANLFCNYDILAALRSPEQLCTDLLDDPQTIVAAARVVSDGYVAAFDRLHSKLAAAEVGCCTWPGCYHSARASMSACDFWCLVSSEIAREMILPVIRRELAPMQRSIFHLDGPGGLRHLDLVLGIPEISAVQWAFGEGHGRAEHWIDVYRRILRSGKSVQVLAEDAKDALAVLDALGPRGVWLQVRREFESTDAARAFVATVARR